MTAREQAADLCPDCHVPAGTRHGGDCATALCTVTGELRVMCAGVHDHGRHVWRGTPRLVATADLPDISDYDGTERDECAQGCPVPGSPGPDDPDWNSHEDASYDQHQEPT